MKGKNVNKRYDANLVLQEGGEDWQVDFVIAIKF